MDDKSKALLEKAEVKEEYAVECLYGDNIGNLSLVKLTIKSTYPI